MILSGTPRRSLLISCVGVRLPEGQNLTGDYGPDLAMLSGDVDVLVGQSSVRKRQVGA